MAHGSVAAGRPAGPEVAGLGGDGVADATSASGARSWPSLTVLFLALSFGAAHVAFADEYYSTQAAVVSGLLGAILVLLVTRYSKLAPPRAPIIEILFAVHYSHYGLPIFHAPLPVGVFQVMPRPDSFDFATLLALLSAISLLLGFALAWLGSSRISGGSLLPKLDPVTIDRAASVHFVISSAFVLANGRVPAFHDAVLFGDGIFRELISGIPLASVAALAYFARPSLTSSLRLLAAFGVLLVEVGGSTMLNEILLPCVAVVTILWASRRRLPVITLGFAAALVVVLQPIKVEYRTARTLHPDAALIDDLGEAFSDASGSDSSFGAGGDPTGQTLARVGGLATLAYVLEVVPEKVPHGGGAVYAPAAESLIPRVVWPDKPNLIDTAQNPFTLALGLQSAENVRGGSVAGFHLVVQGYFEHGVAGGIAWMMVLGVLLGLVSRYCGTTPAGTLVAACFIGNLSLQLEGGFTNTFGMIWQLVVGSTTLAWLLWFGGGGHKIGRRA